MRVLPRQAERGAALADQGRHDRARRRAQFHRILQRHSRVRRDPGLLHPVLLAPRPDRETEERLPAAALRQLEGSRLQRHHPLFLGDRPRQGHHLRADLHDQGRAGRRRRVSPALLERRAQPIREHQRFLVRHERLPVRRAIPKTGSVAMRSAAAASTSTSAGAPGSTSAARRTRPIFAASGSSTRSRRCCRTASSRPSSRAPISRRMPTPSRRCGRTSTTRGSRWCCRCCSGIWTVAPTGSAGS